MKVALLHPSLAVRGGAEYVLLWLADELHHRGHDVTVITSAYDPGLFGPVEQRPFSISILPLGGYSTDPAIIVRAGWRLRRVLAAFDWINPHNFPAYVWAFLARVANPRIGPIIWFCEEPVRWFYPDVCNPHVLELRRRTDGVDLRPAWRRRVLTAGRRLRNWRWETARVLDRWVVPRLDAVVANSEFIAGQVRAIFHRSAVACHLGIPLRRFHGTGTEPARRERPYLLTVSRLFPEKNISSILEAVRLLKMRGPLPFRRFVIVGDGPLRAVLESTVVAWGLAEVVEFAGAVSDVALDTLYSNAELVIYLPLDETFGLVFLEAALHRRAVLGPDHGGPAEIVRHRVTGLQVDPLNPRAIAAGIVEALQDPHRRRSWGEEGYREVMREYTFERFVDRFEASIRPVITR